MAYGCQSAPAVAKELGVAVAQVYKVLPGARGGAVAERGEQAGLEAPAGGGVGSPAGLEHSTGEHLTVEWAGIARVAGDVLVLAFKR